MSGRLELVLPSIPFRSAQGLRVLALFSAATSLLCACGVSDEVAAQERSSEPTANASTLEQPSSESALVGVPDEMQDFAYLAAHTPSGQAPTDWDGTISGMKTLWHKNGVKRGEGEYVNSKKVGAWIYWHDNGQKRWEGTYVADAPQGLELAWYDDGTLQYSGKFVDGLREGPFSYWHENGQLWWKGPFKGDIREGSFIQWKRNGEFDEEGSGVYHAGKRMNELSDQVRDRLLEEPN